jgi:hypothetical protein
MQQALDYLAQHLHDCPVPVLRDSQFQLSDGYEVSQTMTVTHDGNVYTSDWLEDEGVVLLDKVSGTGGAMEVRCGEGGTVQARHGPGDSWKHVIFLGLSHEVMEWLLHHTPPGRALCAEGEAVLGDMAQLCDRGLLPLAVQPSPQVLPRAHVSGEEGVRGWTVAVVVVGVFVVLGVIASILLWRWKVVDNDVVRIWSPAAPVGLPNVTAVPPTTAAAVIAPAAAAAAALVSNGGHPRWEDGPWINL